MTVVREEKVKGAGFDLPITLMKEGKTYSVAIDGVLWTKTDIEHHAVVMFHMLKDHVTEYMHYEKRE